MRFAIVALLLAFFSQFAFAKGLLVSTHPIFLIAQDVTKGVEQPTLLLTPQQTGHDIQLTPKSRQLLKNADLVIWLGQAHEAPLKQAVAGNRHAVALLDSSIIKVLPKRSVKGEILNHTQDTHVWLEPNNAVRIAFFIAALRSQQYPEHKAAYWQNAEQFAKKMYDATKVSWLKKQQYYWAYHDAYQYLERVLNLNFVGALSADHDLAPTAAQLNFLNQKRPVKRMCLLTEYHTNQSILSILKPVKMVSVDESMSEENDFVAGWIKLANSIKHCD